MTGGDTTNYDRLKLGFAGAATALLSLLVLIALIGTPGTAAELTNQSVSVTEDTDAIHTDVHWNSTAGTNGITVAVNVPDSSGTEVASRSLSATASGTSSVQFEPANIDGMSAGNDYTVTINVDDTSYVSGSTISVATELGNHSVDVTEDSEYLYADATFNATAGTDGVNVSVSVLDANATEVASGTIQGVDNDTASTEWDVGSNDNLSADSTYDVVLTTTADTSYITETDAGTYQKTSGGGGGFLPTGVSPLAVLAATILIGVAAMVAKE